MFKQIGIAAVALASLGVASASSAELSSQADALTADVPIALLVDLTSGQTLYSRNADRRFIPASITKVMSAYVAFELIDAGKIRLDQNFTMSAAAGKEWHRKGSTMFLETGDTVNVDTLLRGITSVSANDAAIVLAEGSLGSVDNWTAKMNATARDLKMHDSHFGTPNGWPDGGKTFTTAHDLQLLAAALIERHPDKYARYFGKDGFRYKGYAQANHDPISGKVAGADGIKTGFTNQAGNGFLGSAKRGDTRLVMVTAAVESDAVRGVAARQLITWGFEGFDRKQWFGADTVLGQARVQNGNRSLVALKASNPIIVAVPRDAATIPTFTLVYEGPLEAPIAKGETVAELEIKVAGLPTSRVPLVAANDVAEANFFQRIANAFQKWSN
ncbi:MAG: D-alanyl-D-alanine carboxypeptidase family protein [Pontixanthobacter sp.]